MNFCDKCHKIISDEEIVHYEANAFCDQDRYVHQYQEYVNLNGPSDGFNFCGGLVTQYCGNIREPSEEEYFMYITCQMKE